MNNEVIRWLCEDDNPAVKYRTERDILGASPDKSAAIAWLTKFLPVTWPETKGMWFTYYITSCSVCGLTAEELPKVAVDCAIARVNENFANGCEDFMLLTALVRLGLYERPEVKTAIKGLKSSVLPDGGFLCERRLGKFNYTPKSCYKADLHALMFLAECRKKGIASDIEPGILNYFFNHKLFYKSSKPDELILDGKPGWRTIDVFDPCEPMRVGIHNVVEAFAALGFGNDPRLSEAWELLNKSRDTDGRLTLEGTLSKSYLPKEKLGKPSKWATFFAELAEHERETVEAAL